MGISRPERKVLEDVDVASRRQGSVSRESQGPHDCSGQQRRHRVADLVILAQVLLGNAPLACEKLLTDDRPLSTEDVPIGERLYPGPFARSEVPVQERVNEVGVEAGRDGVARPIRMHTAVVLVIPSCLGVLRSKPGTRRQLLGHMALGLAHADRLEPLDAARGVSHRDVVLHRCAAAGTHGALIGRIQLAVATPR